MKRFLLAFLFFAILIALWDCAFRAKIWSPVLLPAPQQVAEYLKTTAMGLEKELRIHLRTGDTTSTERTRFRNQPSPFLVTTPESLAILLAQESYAQHLAKTEFVIVDELHSFAGNKRGADLSISLERLEDICREVASTGGLEGRATRAQRRRAPPSRGTGSLCRIGLSATAAPLDLLAEFLVGMGRQCRIAEARIEKEQIVDVFSPIRRDPYPPSGYTGARLYAELSQLIRSRQSVIVFTNVRSAAEQIGLRLREHLPELADAIEIHHASLDRSVRLAVEDRLKNGELRAVICSTSLELGIDIGAVDLVVMHGSDSRHYFLYERAGSAAPFRSRSKSRERLRPLPSADPVFPHYFCAAFYSCGAGCSGQWATRPEDLAIGVGMHGHCSNRGDALQPFGRLGNRSAQSQDRDPASSRDQAGGVDFALS